MEGLLVFLTSIAVTVAIDGFEPGIRVKFGSGPISDAGETFLYDLPTTTKAAVSLGWECTPRPPGPLPQLVMYCPSDMVVCCFYDDTGNVAGTQIALLKSDVSENVFNWKKLGFTTWKTKVEGQCKEFWTIQQYFVDAAYLAKCKADRLASRDNSRILQNGAVWVTGIDKELRKISNREEDTIQEKLFLKQACINMMGQHYYYNMSKDIECTDDQIYSWFVMYKNGEISATGFLTIAKLKLASGRDWFERPNLDVVKALVPYGSPCFYKLASNPGAITMHSFFIAKPWEITCPA